MSFSTRKDCLDFFSSTRGALISAKNVGDELKGQWLGRSKGKDSVSGMSLTKSNNSIALLVS